MKQKEPLSILIGISFHSAKGDGSNPCLSGIFTVNCWLGRPVPVRLSNNGGWANFPSSIEEPLADYSIPLIWQFYFSAYCDIRLLFDSNNRKLIFTFYFITFAIENYWWHKCCSVKMAQETMNFISFREKKMDRGKLNTVSILNVHRRLEFEKKKQNKKQNTKILTF